MYLSVLQEGESSHVAPTFFDESKQSLSHPFMSVHSFIF